jgi:uncharacterized protein (TIGR02270 family)
MATSTRSFLVELYREYLEEASFLYEQRLGLLNDVEVTWKGIGDFEERFEAHIDGLVVGGDLALEVCKKQAVEGDFGELHAAVRVFCRQNRKDLLLQVLKEVDLEDPQKIQAVADALKHELPEGWQSEFLKMFSAGEEKLIGILATVFGFRRIKVATNLGDVLATAPPRSFAAVIRAIGRLGEKRAGERLRKFLHHEDESLCLETAVALMRLGDEQPVDHSLQRAPSQGWACLTLALGGGRSVLKELLQRSKMNPITSDGVIALGLFGSSSAIPFLFQCLTNPDLANASAISLQAITGAGLYETVFIPDKIEEDELFEHEREKLKRGEPVTRPDGKPYGTNVTGISINPKTWEKWWSENGKKFNPDAQYRYGKPYSPATLLETLTLDTSPHVLRRWAYEELVIRYAYDFPFEVDMPVSEQESKLADCSHWVASNNARFTPGQWYFSGRPAS